MSDGSAPSSAPEVPDAFYRAFEDRFRGSRALILGRLRAGYQPFVDRIAAEGGARALDLGCGRGEWLEILRDAGIAGRGVDLDAGMLEAARGAGLDVEQRDALEALRAEADGALTLVSGFHIAEHLPFAVLLALMTEARRVLRPGGILILETPNPENLVVGTSSFHLDPTHITPIPPDRMTFMAEFAGFARSVILRLNGPEPGTPSLLNVFTDISVDYGIVAQVEGGGWVGMDDAFARRIGTDLSAVLQGFDRAMDGRLAALAARGEALAADLAAFAAVSAPSRIEHETKISTLLDHIRTLAARGEALTADLAALAYRHDRPFWQKLLFRPSGRPVRLVRRLAFHGSGRPRGGILRRLARRRDGTPRVAFSRWMSSEAYLALAWPAARRPMAPSPEEPLGPDPAGHPRRADLIEALGGATDADGAG